MAPDHGFEPRPPDSESGALPLRQSGKYGDPCGIRTLHCRLERAVTLPVSRRDHASPITWAGLLCCYTKMVLVPVNDNVIYCYPKHCSQYDNVIQCGHSIPPLPHIDRLWFCEAEDFCRSFAAIPAFFLNRVIFTPVAVISMTGIICILFAFLFRSWIPPPLSKQQKYRLPHMRQAVCKF